MGARSRFQGFISSMSRNFPPNLARLMLLCCAALWGGSYVAAKVAMGSIPPQWLMFMRMVGACLLMFALFHRYVLRAMHRNIIVPALIVGVTYYATMALQTIGLNSIAPGRSSFLTAAYCVLTPFVVWIVSRRRPRIINLVAGAVCLIGVGFIALKPSTNSFALSTGDWLTLVSALVFSFNLTALGIYARRFNAVALTFVQFAVAGVLFLAGALFTESPPNASWLDLNVIVSFLYLFICATTLAQVMQNIGLAYVPAASASIIMCTESLFSVVFATLLWHERIGWPSVVGFGLIFAAVLMSVIKRSQIRLVKAD